MTQPPIDQSPQKSAEISDFNRDSACTPSDVRRRNSTAVTKAYAKVSAKPWFVGSTEPQHPFFETRITVPDTTAKQPITIRTAGATDQAALLLDGLGNLSRALLLGAGLRLIRP